MKVERELDLMTTNTFEDLDGMLYGEYLLQDITIEELCEVRSDGWVANKRPDKPKALYLLFPGN